MASLPHGNGKKVRIAVFATGSEAQSASEAGADIVGSDELIARVVTGDIPFDRVIGKDSLEYYVYLVSYSHSLILNRILLSDSGYDG